MKSWQEIQQQTRPRRAVTWAARQRFALALFKKLACLTVAIILFTGAAWWGYRTYEAGKKIRLTGPSEPLREIEIVSDGVLNLSWFQQTGILPGAPTLMEVDHFALKKELERYGQIISAAVTKIFPDGLKIVLAERQPIARLRVAVSSHRTLDFLAAADGAVYRGYHYPQRFINRLPFLETQRLARDKRGIRPIPGMDTVAELLHQAQQLYPNLYGDWRVISCKRFTGQLDDPGAYILIRTRSNGDLLFAPTDFSSQLDLLARTLHYYSRRNYPPLSRIDLSLALPGSPTEAQVVVRYSKELIPL